MKYDLIYTAPDTTYSRHYDTMKEAQNNMWKHFDNRMEYYDNPKTLRGGDWCEISASGNKKFWQILSLDIPKSETIKTTISTREEGVFYFVTLKQLTTDGFTMYKYDNGTTTKLGKSKSPLDLEKRFITN